MTTLTQIRTESARDLAPIRITTRQGTLRPMVISTHGQSCRVALVAQGATLLAGDEVAIMVHVGAGTVLEIVEPAGTVAYNMRGASAQWRVRITVEDGGTLIWAGEPFVVSDGAVVDRSLDAQLGTGAQLLLRETLVLGRADEDGGTLRTSTRIADPGGPVLIEEFELGIASKRPGVLGANRVIESILCVGVNGASGADFMRLDEPGLLWRRVGRDAHSASLSAEWDELKARIHYN